MMTKFQQAMKDWGNLLTSSLIIFGFLYIPWSIKTELSIMKYTQIQMQETLKYGKEQRELLTREVRENITMDIERLRASDKKHEEWQANVMVLLNKTSEGMEKIQTTLESHMRQTR